MPITAFFALPCLLFTVGAFKGAAPLRRHPKANAKAKGVWHLQFFIGFYECMCLKCVSLNCFNFK